MRRLARFLCLPVLLVPAAAAANERHFTYTYETATLPAGDKEIEIWSTPRIGRERYFYRLDSRVEFEIGVTDRWMAALYLNGMTQTAETAPGVLSSASELEGISIENKWKLMDPVADAFGLGLYAEISLGPSETEIEAKLLLDKRVGDLHLAANLVGEMDLDAEGDAAARDVDLEQELAVEVALAAAWFVRSNLSIGLEARDLNAIGGGGLEYSALFAGPVVAYGAEDWWLAFTFVAQLPAVAGERAGERVLDQHEAIEARLLWGFHL